MARGAPQRDVYGHIVALCGIAQDITNRKLVEKRIQFLAYYDSLTGLPNRTLLQVAWLRPSLALIGGPNTRRSCFSILTVSKSSTTRSGMASAIYC